ncbi:lipase/acyltransferase domain-containing protein [Paroceanicella profunda]|nr:hypothetical protein [Paroceanicella profunda]
MPGTMGSRLVDLASGVSVWGGPDGLSPDPRVARNLALLALPLAPEGEEARHLRDSIVPDSVLRAATARVLGVPVEIEVYGGIANMLRLGGWVADDDPNPGSEPVNSYPFAYDWRRDLVDSVSAFDRFVLLHEEENAPPHSLDLMAHSMGTLIARYYLMYGTQDLPEDGSLPELTWAGAQHFSKVVLIAPPNAGSMAALDNLVNGKTLGPLQPFYPAALVGTHFSTYALMPRNRHHRVLWSDTHQPVEDLYDPALWERLGWGLASPDAEEIIADLLPDEPDPEVRRRRALAFLAEALGRAKQFQAALDRPIDALPPGLDIHMVVGGGYTTPAGARVDRETGELTVDTFEEGDGLVLRASSLLDERQGKPYTYGLDTPLKFTSVLFLPEEHVALTQSAVLGDNLLFWLIEGQRTRDSLRPGPLAPGPRIPLLSAAAPGTAPDGRDDTDR